MRQLSPKVSALALASLVALLSASLDAHGVSGKYAVYLQGLNGPAIGPLMYLGAKHMVTGYDHLLFLVGVIFFLYRLKDVLLYVSLFTIGHSVTLHGCYIERQALIGIGSIVLDDVRVGAQSLVAAGSLVSPGTIIPPRSLVMGMPARVKRPLTDEEVANLDHFWQNYVNYSAMYLKDGW